MTDMWFGNPFCDECKDRHPLSYDCRAARARLDASMAASIERLVAGPKWHRYRAQFWVKYRRRVDVIFTLGPGQDMDRALRDVVRQAIAKLNAHWPGVRRGELHLVGIEEVDGPDGPGYVRTGVWPRA